MILNVRRDDLNLFSSFIFLNNVLDSFVRGKNAADRTVMVQCVDQECDIFTHITVDIVRALKKFRCLIDQICCQDTINSTFFVCLVEFVQSVCEQSECCGGKDTFCFAAF